MLRPAAFTDLPGWAEAHPAGAMPALLRGCDRMAAWPPGRKLGGGAQAAALGTAGAWGPVCAAARLVPAGDDTAARRFFEAWFRPYAMGTGNGQRGLFTGYYEPEMAGRLTRGDGYDTPLYRRPADLIDVNLGDFLPDLKGRRIVGRVDGKRLVPYDDRARIEAGALAGRGLALAWLADPVDAFFLQIQGSGRVDLPDGRVMRVGYAAQNGRPYVAIGRLMVARGLIPRDKVSMQSIRAWLEAHPAKGRALMDENPSYVFFRNLGDVPPDQGPPGALGVKLTPEHSVAIDPRFVPLGAPLWIDAGGFHRLVLAQDTGGAIHGPVRADIFFGWGQEAAARAGAMAAHGQAWLLLPKAPVS